LNVYPNNEVNGKTNNRY